MDRNTSQQIGSKLQHIDLGIKLVDMMGPLSRKEWRKTERVHRQLASVLNKHNVTPVVGLWAMYALMETGLTAVAKEIAEAKTAAS